MSSYSKEATAKFELDKAEKEIFENTKDFEKLFEFLKGAAKGGELANNIYTLPYETGTKDLLQKYMKAKANGEVSNVEEFFNKKYTAEKWARGLGIAGAGFNAKEELSKGNSCGSSCRYRTYNGEILINKTLITNSITNGSELFGNHTLLRDGSLANNGFKTLKEFANLNLLIVWICKVSLNL